MTPSHTHITLVGHSGCKLRVKRVRGTLVTVKTSKDSGYNERLRLQIEKQRAYQGSAGKTPEIYHERLNAQGLHEFHMEYIHGKTLAHHLHTLPLSAVQQTATRLIELVRADAVSNPKVNRIFREKVRALRQAMPPTAPPSVRRGLTHLTRVDWSLCEESVCHGDLTLENIIVRDDEFYLIDFLDSFYNSWMVDVAKLLQDLECLWSYRNESVSDNLHVRLLAVKNTIIEHIRARENGEAQLVIIYNLLVLNLLRIIPYTSDPATLEYLYREIERLMEKITTENI